jgi:hypothetical protein
MTGTSQTGATLRVGQVTLEPVQCCLLELRRSALAVEMHDQGRILQRQVRQLAGGVLGHPESSAFDRSTEANVSVRLDGHTNTCSHGAA